MEHVLFSEVGSSPKSVSLRIVGSKHRKSPLLFLAVLWNPTKILFPKGCRRSSGDGPVIESPSLNPKPSTRTLNPKYVISFSFFHCSSILTSSNIEPWAPNLSIGSLRHAARPQHKASPKPYPKPDALQSMYDICNSTKRGDANRMVLLL